MGTFAYIHTLAGNSFSIPLWEEGDILGGRNVLDILQRRIAVVQN